MDTSCGSQRLPFRGWFCLSTLLAQGISCVCCYALSFRMNSQGFPSLPLSCPQYWCYCCKILHPACSPGLELAGWIITASVYPCWANSLAGTFGLSNSEAQAASWFIKLLTSQTPWHSHASVLKCWDYRYEPSHTTRLFNNENITTREPRR